MVFHAVHPGRPGAAPGAVPARAGRARGAGDGARRASTKDVAPETRHAVRHHPPGGWQFEF
jgi:hypothetical protein